MSYKNFSKEKNFVILVKPNKNIFKFYSNIMNNVDIYNTSMNNIEYIVETTKVCKNNECNKEIIEELSKIFGVSKSSVIIVQGHKNRKKYIRIIY